MEKFIAAMGGIVLVFAGVFVAVILGTVMGAFTGWVVSFVYNDTLLGIFALIGIKGYTLSQIGAFLGFTGGFFRAHAANKATSK